jgi:hypothetical protein
MNMGKRPIDPRWKVGPHRLIVNKDFRAGAKTGPGIQVTDHQEQAEQEPVHDSPPVSVNMRTAVKTGWWFYRKDIEVFQDI